MLNNPTPQINRNTGIKSLIRADNDIHMIHIIQRLALPLSPAIAIFLTLSAVTSKPWSDGLAVASQAPAEFQTPSIANEKSPTCDFAIATVRLPPSPPLHLDCLFYSPTFLARAPFAPHSRSKNFLPTKTQWPWLMFCSRFDRPRRMTARSSRATRSSVYA